MDHSYTEAHHIADRYLMGKLPEEEAARFEEHYLHCQECLDELELAKKFQRALRHVVVEQAGARPKAPSRLSDWLAGLRHFPILAPVAAGLLAVMLVPGAFMYSRLNHLEGELDRTRAHLSRVVAPQENTAIYSLGLVRGRDLGDSGPVNVVHLPPSPEWIVLSLDLGRAESATYRATLMGGGDRVLWQSGDLHPNHLDALVVSFYSASLTPGDYVIRTEAVAAEGRSAAPSGSFSFRVSP